MWKRHEVLPRGIVGREPSLLGNFMELMEPENRWRNDLGPVLISADIEWALFWGLTFFACQRSLPDLWRHEDREYCPWVVLHAGGLYRPLCHLAHP